MIETTLRSSHFLFPETRESPTLKPETLRIGLVQFTNPISGGFPSRVGVQMIVNDLQIRNDVAMVSQLTWSYSHRRPPYHNRLPKNPKIQLWSKKTLPNRFREPTIWITMNLLLTPYFKPFLFYRSFTHPPQHLAVARIVNLIVTQVIPVIHTIGARYTGWPWWYEQPLVYPSNGMEDQDRFPKLMCFGFCNVVVVVLKDNGDKRKGEGWWSSNIIFSHHLNSLSMAFFFHTSRVSCRLDTESSLAISFSKMEQLLQEARGQPRLQRGLNGRRRPSAVKLTNVKALRIM